MAMAGQPPVNAEENQCRSHDHAEPGSPGGRRLVHAAEQPRRRDTQCCQCGQSGQPTGQKVADLLLCFGADGEFAYRVSESAARAAAESCCVQDQPDGFLSAWL